MSTCEHLIPCLLNSDILKKLPGQFELIRIRYCDGEFANCARFRMMEEHGQENVSNELLPVGFLDNEAEYNGA